LSLPGGRRGLYRGGAVARTLFTPAEEVMNRPALLGAAAVAALALWSQPSAAHAKGITLITHGDTINHLGHVAPDRRSADLPATAVGFKYSYFGVFWLDLWTWGGTYCLYQDKTYWELPPEAAAHLLNKSEADLGKPFLYHVPLGLVILIAVVGYFLVLSVIHKSPEQKLDALLKEERYQKALEIFHAHANAPAEAPPAAAPEASTAAPPAGAAAAPAATAEEQERTRLTAGFEAAVEYLAGQGVEREEAGRNLAALLSRAQTANAG
jgi:hypothetical protein